MPRQARNERGDLPGIEPLHIPGLVRCEAARVGSEADPVEFDKPDAAGRYLVQVPPPLQACPLEIDERFRVTPLMRLGNEQARGTSGRPGTEPARLYQLHGTEPGVLNGRRRSDAQDASADNQHIRARLCYYAWIAPEYRPLLTRQ